MVVPSPPPLDNGALDQPALDKRGLRAAMRARRSAIDRTLGSDERAALERRLAESLAPLLADAQRIAGYQPMAGEISPLAALDRARASGRTIAFPGFATRDSPMQFRGAPASIEGPWGQLQPESGSPLVEPDLVLVPLIAIDRKGNRIGQGKGHYDRVLDGLRRSGARLVGVGWSFQLVDQAIAAHPWDVALDAFASPDGLREFSR